MLCFFVTSYRKCHTHRLHIRFLGRLLTYPFCFKLTPKGCMIWTTCCDSEGQVFSHRILWPYLVMLGLLTTPHDVTRPQILMLYNQEVWKSRRTSLVITCCRNRCPNTSPKFLCYWSLSTSRTSKLFNSRAASFVTTAHSISYFCYHLSTNYNKSTILPFKSCDWFLEYQFLSVQHEPCTSFPQ